MFGNVKHFIPEEVKKTYVWYVLKVHIIQIIQHGGKYLWSFEISSETCMDMTEILSERENLKGTIRSWLQRQQGNGNGRFYRDNMTRS